MPSQEKDTNKLQTVLRVGENDPPLFIQVRSARFVIRLRAGIVSMKIINTFHHLQNIICTFRRSLPWCFLQRPHLLCIPYFSTRGLSCLCCPGGTQSPRDELFTPPRPAIVPWLRGYWGLGSAQACPAHVVSVGGGKWDTKFLIISIMSVGLY